MFAPVRSKVAPAPLVRVMPAPTPPEMFAEMVSVLAVLLPTPKLITRVPAPSPRLPLISWLPKALESEAILPASVSIPRPVVTEAVCPAALTPRYILATVSLKPARSTVPVPLRFNAPVSGNTLLAPLRRIPALTLVPPV